MAVFGKKNIAEFLSVELGVSASAAERATTALLAEFGREIAEGNDISLTGVGRIRPVKRAARTCNNPRDPGLKLNVPARMSARFSPSSELLEALNG